jgi:diguanylate cyclase (GGDEF)-like protein
MDPMPDQMADDHGRNTGDGDETSEAHEKAAEARDERAETRDDTAETRDDTAETRDDTAETRDERAEARDHMAEARDDTAKTRDDKAQTRDQGVDETADRAEALRDRRGAARDRADAASDREAAWSDRAVAAQGREAAWSDRAVAAEGREVALSDRAVAAEERVVSSIDALTGLHRRDAGVIELEREIARARRTETPFILAFVDVDGLKATNDSLGHAAGDHLLRKVADTLRANLRSYDLIVRFGGDEFACGLLDLEVEEVARRFALINADLEETQQASVTVGLAVLEEQDSLETLIDRADAALYKQRQERPRSAQ